MTIVNANLKQQLQTALKQLETCFSGPPQLNDSILQQLSNQVAVIAQQICNENEKELNQITQELANLGRLQRWCQVMNMPESFERMKDEFREIFTSLGQKPSEVLDDTLQVRLVRKWPDRIQQRITDLADHLNDVLKWCEPFPNQPGNAHLRPVLELHYQCELDLMKLLQKTLCVVSQAGKVLDKNKGPHSAGASQSADHKDKKPGKKAKSGKYNMDEVDDNDYLLAARILVDGHWKKYIDLSEITAQIISLSDAQDLESGRKELSKLSIVGCFKTKKNDVIKPATIMKQDRADVALFEIYEPSRKESASAVSESFYCFLLKAKCQLSNERTFEIYTTSSIFGLTVRCSQTNLYRMGTLWNYCFAAGTRVDVDVPMNKFLNFLGNYFLFYTGAEKSLDPDELVYLGQKIMNLDNVNEINTTMLKKDSIKNLYKNGSEVDTKFSDWFFQIMDMIKTRFLGDWNDRLLRFADRATAEKALSNIGSKCCYVRFPETFDEALCFDFIKGKDSSGAPAFDHLLLNLTGNNSGIFNNRNSWDLIKLISITKDLEEITDIYPNNKIEHLRARKEMQSGTKRKANSGLSEIDYKHLHGKYTIVQHQSIFKKVDTQYNVKRIQASLGTISQSDGTLAAALPLPCISNIVSSRPDVTQVGIAESVTQASAISPGKIRIQTSAINGQNIYQLLNEELEMPTGFVEYFRSKMSASFEKQVYATTPTISNCNDSTVSVQNLTETSPGQQIQDSNDSGWENGSAQIPMDISGSGIMDPPGMLQQFNFPPTLVPSFTSNPRQIIQHILTGNNNNVNNYNETTMNFASNDQQNISPQISAALSSGGSPVYQQVPIGCSHPQPSNSAGIIAPINQSQVANLQQQGGVFQLVYSQIGPDGQISYQPISVLPNSSHVNPNAGPGQHHLQQVCNGSSPVTFTQQVQSPVLGQNGSVDQRVPAGLTPVTNQQPNDVIYNGQSPSFVNANPIGNCNSFSPVSPINQQSNTTFGAFSGQIIGVNCSGQDNQLQNSTFTGMMGGNSNSSGCSEMDDSLSFMDLQTAIGQGVSFVSQNGMVTQQQQSGNFQNSALDSLSG